MAPWTGAHLDNVLVQGNHAYSGGGITLWNNFETVHITNSKIVGNSAGNLGGGIWAGGTTYQIVHSVIAGNSSHAGGAIYHTAPDPFPDPCPCPPATTIGDVEFTTIAGNTATSGATGIYDNFDGLTVQNSIVAQSGLAVDARASITWRYNDTTGTFSGMSPTGHDGNIATDPGFVDPSGDYHLAPGSACINAGDPSISDPDGSRADMGAYGGAM
jgi:hypothetical protein